MSFLKDVIIPNSPVGTKLPTSMGGGTFLNSVVIPNAQGQAQAQKLATLSSQEQISKQNADYANSFTGIAKNTLSDLGHRLINVPIDFVKSLWGTYQATPNKIAEDISAGVQDMQTGGTVEQQATGLFKGAIKTGVRTAGDAAIAIFAPISSAIGAVLTATGGQPLMDKAGQVVADSSGITDLLAFQKFAMEHPNAGEDFNRILTLFMSAGEKGTIDPVRITQEANVLALKLTGVAPDALKGGEAFARTGIVRKVPVAGESLPQDVPINRLEKRIPVSNETPQAQNVPFQNRYEPPTTIPLGAKGKSALPTIQIGVPIKSPYQYEPIVQNGFLNNVDVPKASTASSVRPKTATRSTTIPKVENTAPTVAEAPKMPVSPMETAAKTLAPNEAPNTRAITLEKAAVAQKLTEGLGKLPTHDQMSMTDQANLAYDYARANPEHAMQVAMGDSLPPNHILPESIYTAMEIKAIREGDVATLRNLANSKVPTRAGQSFKALDSSDPNSPVKIMRDIKNAREAVAEKKSGKTAKKDTVNEIKKEIKVNVSKRPTWEEFTKNLTCNI